MSKLPFSFFKQNGAEYEVVDKVAREAISDNASDNWLVVGDSYFGLYPDTSGTTVGQHMRAMSGRDTTQLKDFCYSGEGFVKTKDGENFLSSFTTDSAQFSDTYKNSISKIVVAAGRNDYESSKSAINTAINNFVSFCKNTYPNAVIYLAYIGNGKNTGNGTREQQYTVYEAYRENTQSIYLNGTEAILKNTDLMSSDFLHPNADGREMLAKYLLQAIETGSAHVNYPRHEATFTVSLAGASSSYATSHFYEEVIDGEVVLTTDNIGAISFSTGNEIPANGSVNLAYGICNSKYVKYPVNDLILPAKFTSVMSSESATQIDIAGVYGASLRYAVDGNVYLDFFGSVKASPYSRTINYIMFEGTTETIPSVLT